MKELVIKDFCYISDGNYSSKYPRSDEFKESGIPFIRANNLVNGTVVSDDMYFISPEKHLELRKGHLQTDDVLITTRGNIGQTAVVPAEFHDANINAQIVLLRVDKEKIIPKYLEYALHTDTVVQQIESSITGTALKQLPVGRLEKIKVKIHPKNEQEHIVSVLQKMDALISAQKEQLETTEIIVKSRFIEMFGDPETNPYGWEQTTVGDVCSSIVRGPFGSALKKEFFVEPNETTYKVYEQKHAIQKSATIGTYYVTAEKFAELKRFECVAGDILMSCSGTMGELYQLPQNCEKGLINQALCKFTLNEKILPIVFLNYMKNTVGNLETKGSGIQNIAAVSYVKAMPINLPPIEVQTQFAEFVEQTDKLKFEVKESLEKLETLKKSLMQQYFG